MRRGRWELSAIALAAALPFIPMILRGEVPVFRDHRDYFLPLREFTAAALRSFQLPLWNPLNASGEPWLANPQTGVFYPPTWLFVALPLKIAYLAFLAFHLFVLGAGTLVLFRRWMTREMALLGALAFTLSGPVLSLLDVSNNLASFAWIPWAMLAALVRDDSTHARDALVLALCFLGGEPFLAASGALLYVAIRLVRERSRAIVSIAAAGLLALFISSAQLVPFVESLRGSDRAVGLEPAAALKGSLAPADWLAMPVSPMSPDGTVTLVAPSQSFLPSLYLAPLIVLFCASAPALLAARAGVPRRVVVSWFALLVVMLSGAAGGQVAWIARLYTALHLNVNRYPAKLALFGVLALAFLGSLAFDSAASAARRRRLAAIASMGVVGGLSIALFSPNPLSSALLLAWIAVAAAMLLVDRLRASRALASCLVVLVCADSLLASRFLLASGALAPDVQPYASILDRSKKVIRLEQFDRQSGRGKIGIDRGAWLGGYLNLRNGQFDASTAAPVISERYQLLHDFALATPRLDILDSMSVGYVMTTRELVHPGLAKIASVRGVNTYQRDGAFAMVALWEDYEPVADDQAALRALFEQPGVARSRIFVRGGAPPRAGNAASGPVGQARILELGLNEVTAEATSPRGGVVMLNQCDAPGWSVTVDGAPRHALRVNGLFRGVAIPAGTHEVCWRYEPRSLPVGVAMSMIGIAVCGIEIARHRRTRRKL